MGSKYLRLQGAGLALFLASCGGGSSSSPTPPAPQNNIPTISIDSSSVAVAENYTGILATATANDPDGDTLSFSLAGDDADDFQIDGAGRISFRQAPNFDRPTDNDFDNRYELVIRATDGRATASVSAVVTVSNDREGISLGRVIATGEPQLIVAPVASSGNLLFIRSNGDMSQFDPDTTTETPLRNVFLPGETGKVLGAIQDRSWIFVMVAIEGRGVAIRFHHATNTFASITTSDLTASVDPSVGGTMFMTPTGMFAALGSGSGADAQDPASGFGKLFRISFDPYCGASLNTICLGTEVIGDGIHDPRGGGSSNGKAFLFDRGDTLEDEISAFDISTTSADFGWPYYEGISALTANAPSMVNAPFLRYLRGSGFGQGAGIVGGEVYSGSVATLAGKIVFADLSGKILALEGSAPTGGGIRTGTEVEDRTMDFDIAGAALGEPAKVFVAGNGQLYIVNSEGSIFRLIES